MDSPAPSRQHAFELPDSHSEPAYWYAGGIDVLRYRRHRRVTVKYSNNPYLVNQDKTNFAPRVGLAYRFSHRATVRAGYGMFYGGIESVGYSPNLGTNVPFVYTSQYNTPATQGISLENGFTAICGTCQTGQALLGGVTLPALRGVSPNPKTSYSENYSLAVEYGITKQHGGHAFLCWIANPPPDRHYQPERASGIVGPSYSGNLVPLPDFGGADFSAYDGVSNYNSMQAKLERRFANGLSFLATYTWVHSLDDAPTPLGSGGDGGYPNTNVQPIRGQYSNSPFDTRQRFTMNGNYQLPLAAVRNLSTTSESSITWSVAGLPASPSPRKRGTHSRSMLQAPASRPLREPAANRYTTRRWWVILSKAGGLPPTATLG